MGRIIAYRIIHVNMQLTEIATVQNGVISTRLLQAFALGTLHQPPGAARHGDLGPPASAL
jgi:hypothetical protein